MNYREALNYIEEKGKVGITPGLTRIIELLKRLGDPQDKVPAIHIAGTNGKGSIMAYIEETLILSGLKVGRYISPAIFDYRERWKINKEEISEEDVARAVTFISKAIEEMVNEGMECPSSFEIETAAAFYMFKENDCDIMLIECGMGGKGDATNVMKHKVVDILASVSLDHMEYLGNTIEEITKEKLGIVKKNDMLVTYPLIPEVEKAVENYMVDHEFRWRKAESDALHVIKSDLDGSTFFYRGMEYAISMLGSYQIYNAVCAIEAVQAYNRYALKNGEIEISYETLKEGLLKSSWPGRFSVIRKAPYVIVDGAHNPDAWAKLKESFELYFPAKKAIFVAGVFRDKDFDKMIDILGPYMKRCYTVTAPGIRGLPAEDLAKYMANKSIDSKACANANQALSCAIEAAGSRGVVVVTGSLSYIGQFVTMEIAKG